MNMQQILHDTLTQYAKEEGTTLQNAVRDLLADLHHYSDKREVDFQLAQDSADELYNDQFGRTWDMATGYKEDDV